MTHVINWFAIGLFVAGITASAHVFVHNAAEFSRLAHIRTAGLYNFVLNLAEIPDKQARVNVHRAVLMALQDEPDITAVSRQ